MVLDLLSLNFIALRISVDLSVVTGSVQFINILVLVNVPKISSATNSR